MTKTLNSLLLSTAIVRAPEGVDAGGAADNKGSAPELSAADVLYGKQTALGEGAKDEAAKSDDEAAKATAAAEAAKAGATDPGKDQGKKADGAEGQKADDQPAAVKLTDEAKAILEKALADATTDEAKATAQAALDKAKASHELAVKAEFEAAPFDPTKISLPEGMTVNEQLLADFAPVAKELGLPQKAGQKMVDQYIKLKQGEAAQHAETVKGWLETAKADPAIGKQNWDKTISTSKRALAKFEAETKDTGFTELMDLLGIGNHPSVIRYVHWSAAQTADDEPVIPTVKAGSVESQIEILYGKPKA